MGRIFRWCRMCIRLPMVSFSSPPPPPPPLPFSCLFTFFFVEHDANVGTVNRYRVGCHGRSGQSRGYRLCDHLPVQWQELRQGVLDHWYHDYLYQSVVELDTTDTQGTDWWSLGLDCEVWRKDG